jgi:hypothetical protein
MKERVRALRPSPAMGVALLALFVALGGVGYAAATIDSADIKDDTIRGWDIHNGTIRNGDLAPNALDGSRIRESRLLPVPRARGLNTLRGDFKLARIEGQLDVADPAQTILRLEGLVLRADCAPDGDLTVTARTAVNNAFIHIANVHGPNQTGYAQDDDFDRGEGVNAVPGGDDGAEVSLSYSHPSGLIVTADFLGQEKTNRPQSIADCHVLGRADGSIGVAVAQGRGRP